MRFYSLALLLLLVVPQASAQDRALTPLQTIPQLFTRGYEALKVGPREALPVFEEIVRRDPTNVMALRQLGSIYVNLEERTAALQMFEASERILPSDTTRLQIAYLYNALGNNSRALALFGLLRRSKDPQIAATARRAIDILTPLYCWEKGVWWTRAIGSVHYDHRFEDVIASLSFQVGRELLGDRVLSVYGNITLNKDSRSTGGLQPVIYSDNYFLGAIGLRLQPTRWWTLDFQPGVTVDLLDRPGKERVDFDYRMLTILGGGISAVVEVPSTLKAPFAPFTDAFLSAGYYSRYKNVIGYSQLRAGFRALEYRHTAFDLYARGDFTFDALSAHREFYNNTIEGSLGARIVPDHRWGINLLVEFHRGSYWMDPPYGSGPSRWYNSFRVILAIDRYLCL
jgi:tetratricopeptide (TPR) repeat protein